MKTENPVCAVHDVFMEIFCSFNALNFNEYEKSNLDHVHFVILDDNDCEKKGNDVRNSTNLIKMHYTLNLKLHVSS